MYDAIYHDREILSSREALKPEETEGFHSSGLTGGQMDDWLLHII